MRNKKNLLVKKTNAEYTEYSAYTADGKLLYVERSLKNGTDELTEYIWAGSTLWAEKRTAGTESAVYYHHADYHGTTEVITDESAVVVWKAGYDAYGNVLEATGEMEFEASFTGKMFDKDSGLYYFNARWYDSELGRFTTPDPARDGTNWLVYCAANPVGRWDPTGLNTLDDFAYQQRTEASAAARKDKTVQNIADDLVSKGQSKIAAKDIYYGSQKMTQALSVAVVGNTQYLDDKTRQSLQGKSAAEVEAILDQVTYVFGVHRDDVTKMRAELKAQGIDIDFAPENDSDAFSVAGYVFVFEQESDWGKTGSDGKFSLTGRLSELNKYLAGHELIHQLQSQAWGGPSSFLAEYNRQYIANKSKYSKATYPDNIIQPYVNVNFEKAAYTFGPYYSLAKTNIPTSYDSNNLPCTYTFIAW